MFASRLAGSAALRRGLHQQALQGNRFTAIRAVAVDPGVEPMQGGFHLGHLVDIALLLRPIEVRTQPLRGLVLTVCHLVRRSVGRLSLSLLGRVNLGAQFVQTVCQQIAQCRQVGLGGEIHDRSVRLGIGCWAVHGRFWNLGRQGRLTSINRSRRLGAMIYRKAWGRQTPRLMLGF